MTFIDEQKEKATNDRCIWDYDATTCSCCGPDFDHELYKKDLEQIVEETIKATAKEILDAYTKHITLDSMIDRCSELIGNND